MLTLSKAQQEELWRLIETERQWGIVLGRAIAVNDILITHEARGVLSETRGKIEAMGIKTPA